MELVYDGYRYLGGNVYAGQAFCRSVGREDRERCIVLGVRFSMYLQYIGYIYPARFDVHPDGNLQ